MNAPMRRATLILSAALLYAVAIPAHRDASGGEAVVPSSTPRPTPSCSPCMMRIVFSENFDNVMPPTLPLGWIATNAQGPPPLWVTSNAGVPPPPYDSFPNAAFIDDPAVVSDKRLDSAPIYGPILEPETPFTFRHSYNLEASGNDPNLGFDGGVLEISIDNGNTYQDILAIGGTFLTGGYNRTISTDRGSPIAGRQAWSGNSGGFISTEFTLPFIFAGGLRVRWRMVSDTTGTGEGWRVDTIYAAWCIAMSCNTPTATPTPRRTPAPRSRPTPLPRPTP